MAEICLLVEGSYPYVTGGVSNWVHELVRNLSHLTFSLVHIGANPDTAREMRYHLPSNVVAFHEIFLNTTMRDRGPAKRGYDSEAWNHFRTLYEAVALGKTYDDIRDFTALVREPGFAGLTALDLLYKRESWDLLVQLYQRHAHQESFVDFFWTYRLTYLPIFAVLEAALPSARVYHAVSTGYCGLYGALASIRSGRPLLLTEHGIYTREREIEIMQSTWINQLTPNSSQSHQRLSFFQQWWLNIYRFMEHVTYQAADSIISIASVNQKYQLKHGADPGKVRIIPNGIHTAQLARLARETNAERFLVGFVGRIVPIKDVKTFIRAIKIASETIPYLEAYLVGPTEEDMHYFQECRRLVELFNLTEITHFTGPTDVKPYYSKLDVVVLTSLSEGQPLVILEASCAGVPVIATDVGACRELLTGISADDQALGPAGLITPVASPTRTAQAIIQLWRNADLRQRMGSAGQQRVQQFYRQEHLYKAYSDLYCEYLLQKTARGLR